METEPFAPPERYRHRPMAFSRFFAPVLFVSLAPALVVAQTSVPPNQVQNLKDTSQLKPPAGAKIAIIEYEDLECPYCARAFPIVHAAAKHYNLPLAEYDFQIPGHKWSHEAAIFAHYLHAKVSPQLAEEFRRELFASQFRIASRDDLRTFEQNFMSKNGKQIPATVDPTGEFDREVQASTAQGKDLGLIETPSIFVVTPDHWIQVRDYEDLTQAIEQAEAETAHPAAAAHR